MSNKKNYFAFFASMLIWIGWAEVFLLEIIKENIKTANYLTFYILFVPFYVLPSVIPCTFLLAGIFSVISLLPEKNNRISFDVPLLVSIGCSFVFYFIFRMFNE
ncbi:hypothetical protein HA050_11300 [Iodobacter sp. HSC-16F04]|uniref:Uncharacterized protein n=1 Tax=Iodobacter violaceini TaxID=3044271 RepID=A0ABX0L2C7_9NEIS|nr:hypothetical protein [Iodobacter violacea]NHQ86703.1 hypothetical protein [Iodobacter violacea]